MHVWFGPISPWTSRASAERLSTQSFEPHFCRTPDMNSHGIEAHKVTENCGDRSH